MTAIDLVVPGSIEQRTGGYVYDRRVAHGLRALGRVVRIHQLDGCFPLTDPVARQAAADVLSDLRNLAVIDGLALPAFADVADRLPRAWVALVHHPLALETGLSSEDADQLERIERDLLRRAARVIVTSERSRRDLAAYEVDRRRVGVVVPGTDAAPLARGSGGPGLALLCVATLTPRKGHVVLLDALAGLRDLPWRLTCVGSTERDPSTTRAIERAVAAHGLEGRVDLVGERDGDELRSYYDAADLFVLASYHEGYGMVLAEALARGLPVLATTAGAIPDTVPPGAGVLVPPGDATALEAALRRLITDHDAHAALVAGARAARRNLLGWDHTARVFAAELDRLAA